MGNVPRFTRVDEKNLIQVALVSLTVATGLTYSLYTVWRS